MKKNPAVHHGRGTAAFLAQHGADVTGVIAGFDRLRLRGSLRYFYQPTFMHRHLCAVGVLLKNFGSNATALSERVRDAAHAFARHCGRPVRHLYSTAERKELLACALAERDGITEGLIGVFDIVEPCLTYFVRGDHAAHQLHLELKPGKCLHHYFYFQHPEFGLMHVRLQTWFPFQVMVLSQWPAVARAPARPRAGRLPPARQLFCVIKDPVRAQALADAQLRTDWPSQLQPLLKYCHTLAEEICRPLAQSYYWSIDQSEYATDLMFKSPAALAAIYPALIHYGTSAPRRYCASSAAPTSTAVDPGLGPGQRLSGSVRNSHLPRPCTPAQTAWRASNEPLEGVGKVRFVGEARLGGNVF